MFDVIDVVVDKCQVDRVNDGRAVPDINSHI